MSVAKNDPLIPADEPIIEFTRLLDAPRELVWEVWTDPRHVAQWFGPAGFSITNHSMTVKKGGTWEFVMHGPDGTDYDNIITYDEIVKPARLVYRHGEPGNPDQFHVTLTFADEGGKTRLVMRSRFPSVAVRDQLLRDVGAAEGGTQTLDRLTDYVRQQHAARKKGPAMDIVKAGTTVNLTRIFNAPRELVFSMWTDETHFRAWWGPTGSQNGETRLDVRPGGEIFIEMRGPGFGHPMGGEYVELDPPRRLVFLSRAFQNPDGSWKFVNHNTVTFEELGGKTKMTLHCVVRQADEDIGIPVAGMEAGWSGSLDRLGELVARLGAA
ncbi:MAG: SRPBCC family protein [Rhizomicrobium sp.]